MVLGGICPIMFMNIIKIIIVNIISITKIQIITINHDDDAGVLEVLGGLEDLVLSIITIIIIRIFIVIIIFTTMQVSARWLEGEKTLSRRREEAQGSLRRRRLV